MLKGSEVSRYIVGINDLMFPGISIPAEGLPSFIAGEAWAVKVPGNPAPIAVGTTTMSSTEAVKAGLRGKALKIMHYYHDLLWESVECPYVPNAGFFEDVVFEDPTLSSSQVSDSYSGANDSSNDQQNGISDKENGQSVDVAVVLSEPSSASVAQTNSGNDIAKEIAAHVDDLKLTDDGSADQSTGEDQHPLSTEDVDLLLEKCLLQALLLRIKIFPCLEALWSNHVLPCRPSGITLDIKKSSYRKLSKWLQAKSSTGLGSTAFHFLLLQREPF